MEVKIVRGDIAELRDSINETISEVHPDKIKDFQIFPINPKFEGELNNEPYYDVFMIVEDA